MAASSALAGHRLNFGAASQGTRTFNDQEQEVNRTTTVDITDVGTAKVDVSAEVKSDAGL